MTEEDLSLCKAFCADLTKEYSPAEAEASDYLFDVVTSIAGETTTMRAEGPSEFGFGFDAETASTALHVIGGTMALVHMYLTSRTLREERENTSKLRNQWTQLLIEQGLEPAVARDIPLRHMGDLAALLAKLQAGARSRETAYGQGDQ